MPRRGNQLEYGNLRNDIRGIKPYFYFPVRTSKNNQESVISSTKLMNIKNHSLLKINIGMDNSSGLGHQWIGEEFEIPIVSPFLLNSN